MPSTTLVLGKKPRVREGRGQRTDSLCAHKHMPEAEEDFRVPYHPEWVQLRWAQLNQILNLVQQGLHPLVPQLPETGVPSLLPHCSP